MNRPRVALCLTGDVRNDMVSFPYIYESFLQNNKGRNSYDIDVYISSWNNTFRSLKLYQPKASIFEHNSYDIFLNFLKNLNPQTKKIVNEFTPTTLTNSIHPLKNTFLMYMANKTCFNLIEEEYDFYIKCRFDLFFQEPVNLLNLFNIINTTKYDSIATMVSGKDLDNQYDDQLFISNYKGFKIYCNLIDYIEQIICKANTISPEILLTTYLKNNVNVCSWNFKKNIIRNSQLFLFPPYEYSL